MYYKVILFFSIINLIVWAIWAIAYIAGRLDERDYIVKQILHQSSIFRYTPTGKQLEALAQQVSKKS